MNKVWHPIATYGDAVLFFRVRKPDLAETGSSDILHSASMGSVNSLIVRGDGIFPASFIPLVTREYQDWQAIPGDRLAETLFAFDYGNTSDDTDFSRALRGDPEVINKYTQKSSTKWSASSAMMNFADSFEKLGIPAPSNRAAVSTKEQVQ